MKTILLTIFMACSFLASAQEKKNRNAKYTVEVNGNCKQCKQRIEKAAFGVPGVKSAVWNLESHELSLIINEEKTSVHEVEKAVAGAGHDAGTARASDADYEKLHSCCKYERK